MSDLKSETARMNGAKSRGPTTPEGREKSSRNAVKRGFTSNSIMVLDCESSDQFHELLGDFFTTYQPASAVERDLVEEMVAARWPIRRMWTVETGLLDGEIHNQETEIDNPDSGIHLAAAFRVLADESHSLALNFRYASRVFIAFMTAPSRISASCSRLAHHNRMPPHKLLILNRHPLLSRLRPGIAKRIHPLRNHRPRKSAKRTQPLPSPPSFPSRSVRLTPAGAPRFSACAANSDPISPPAGIVRAGACPIMRISFRLPVRMIHSKVR